MQASLWIRYLFGQGSAIRQVAESRSALWTGICLVLLTSIPRNYDQTFIAEKPFLWFSGALLFSLVSGTWLFTVAYGLAQMRMAGGHKQTPDSRTALGDWCSFMGLFWMTAPIAWLYAIPVERWLDPVMAAKANILLLAVVSLWRVLLMARVIQHLTRASFAMALIWVLLGAATEVGVISFLGSLAQGVARGMGGMRNSPAEELILHMMSVAFTAALWIVPLALLLSLIFGRNLSLQPLPVRRASRFPWESLAVVAVFWSGVAIVPQIQLARNIAVEKSLAEGNARAALDYLSAHRRDQFAPARTLPPKPYEWTVFQQLPDCLDAVQSSDDPWVRVFLVERLDEMMVHYGPRRRRTTEAQTAEEQLKSISDGLRQRGPKADRLMKMIFGLARIPEGQAWLNTNALFLYAVQQTAGEGSTNKYNSSAEQTAWLSLSNRLRDFVPSDFSKSPTNGVGNAPPIQR